MIKITSMFAYTVLALLLVCIGYFATKLGYKNFWSLKSFAIFYPALTGLLISSYYLVKDVFVLTDTDTQYSQEFVQIYKQSKRYPNNLEQIMLTSRVSDNNVNTSKFRGYMNAYFKSVDANQKNITIDDNVAFDIAESSIIEWIFQYFSNQWIHLNGKEKPIYTTSFNTSDLVFNIKQQNKFFQTKVNELSLPEKAKVKYERIPQSEKFVKHGLLTFFSEAFKLEIRISEFGTDNFNPKYNDFDRFTLDLNTSYLNTFKYKKYFVNFSFKIFKDSVLTEDHQLLKEMLNVLMDSYNNEFAWDNLKNRLIHNFTNKLYNNEHFQRYEDVERQQILQKVLELEKSINSIQSSSFQTQQEILKNRELLNTKRDK